MTPEEFKISWKARIEALKANREADCTRIVLDLIAQVRLRVQVFGTDYNERPFVDYTPGYKRERAKAGYQVDHVDFTRTGRMWASVRPATLNETDSGVLIEAAARTPADRDKLRGQRRKRGNILLPSDDEVRIAAEANSQRLRKYLE